MALTRLSHTYNAVIRGFGQKQIIPIANKLLQSDSFINFRYKHVSKKKLPWLPDSKTYPMNLPEPTEEQENLQLEICKEINRQLLPENQKRLFAIILVAGKQIKITDNDIIIVQGYWPPNPGDQLRFEKVLLVGGIDFSLVGRPLLNSEMVNVTGTVIEKTFSNTKYRFYHKPRKQYRRIHFERTQHTMVRINSIDLYPPIHEKKEVEGLDRVY